MAVSVCVLTSLLCGVIFLSLFPFLPFLSFLFFCFSSLEKKPAGGVKNGPTKSNEQKQQERGTRENKNTEEKEARDAHVPLDVELD